ncbi:hypothetical protein BJV78DRAFT_1286191 [Lactifluus subvellereus]|nr:hypothetical protein BJV78DRAFT_1286191 [Lactifluus subvellereus]
MAPLETFGKHTTKSRASDDNVWVHDRAPGAPRTATQSHDLSAQPSNKLIVTNLHYEITPKDLTVYFAILSLHSRVMTFRAISRQFLDKLARSGRSSGVAIVTFETPAEATRAKKQLDGVLAKGQPISIGFDQGTPRRASAPAPSLLNRIQKPPLLNRLGQAQSNAKASLIQSKKLGTLRGRVRTRGTGRSRTSVAPPKSAAELDSEIDAFMAVDGGSGTPSAKPAENGDVEMA